jgi:hypothetical protein
MITKQWLPLLAKCDIKQSVQNKLFDHRAITVDFRALKKNRAIDTISNEMVNNPLTTFVVDFTCFECYIHHAVEINTQLKSDLLYKIGLGRRYLREAAMIMSSSFSGPLSQENEHLLDSFFAELSMLAEELGVT